MNNGLDIVSVIFLGIAVVIFLYLRSILGSRTGNEQQPFDPYSNDNSDNMPNRDQATGRGNDHDNVINMPDQPGAPGNNPPIPEINMDDQIAKYAQEGSELSEGLNQIADRDQSFDPEQFMVGAERAYEMIIEAFAQGDTRLLKRLLAKDVYAGFSQAIDERKEKGQSMTTQFVGFDKVTMLEAEIEDKQAEITVKFKSSLIRYITQDDGTVIEGDEKNIEKITDIWTFSRPVSGRDPNWKLVSTKSEV